MLDEVCSVDIRNNTTGFAGDPHELFVQGNVVVVIVKIRGLFCNKRHLSIYLWFGDFKSIKNKQVKAKNLP